MPSPPIAVADSRPTPVIRIDQVRKVFTVGEVNVEALKGINIEIESGSYVAIMGPSGSGKSTFLNILGCLDRPTSGEYWLGGEDVSEMEDDRVSTVRGKRLGFIFQSYNLIAQLTVIENIQVPLIYQGADLEETLPRCHELAELVGLGDRLDHRPAQLSGGQQQRVAIARSLVNDPLMILADEPTGNLDTTTGLEVLDLIDRLNASGKTIVLVTHDDEVAVRAHRVIHMRDGWIEREVVNRVPTGGARDLPALLNTVKLGIKSLLLHKLRSGLTMLGIIFGVCSVISMLAIGEGASYEAQERIKNLGSTNVIINSFKPPEGNRDSGGGGRSFELNYGLTYLDAARIQDTVPGVNQVVPMRILRENIRVNRNQEPGQVIGTLASYPSVQGIDVVAGRFLCRIDSIYQRNVCVLTESLAKRLFTYEDILNSTVRIQDVYYQVVGLVRETGTFEQRPQKGEMEGEPLDNNVYIPLSTARSRFGETIIRRNTGSFSAERVELHRVVIKMKDTAAVLAAEPQIQTLLDKFHDQNDFELIVPLQLLREAEATKRMFNIVLGSIAAISLLVGGIGIMNIMLATVTERTREIGVRRALGAKRRDIVEQFLIETIVLSIGGGFIGVILGVLVPLGVSIFTDMVTVITPWSVALAFGISGITGIVFGLYPASQAARLDPIEALRHE